MKKSNGVYYIVIFSLFLRLFFYFFQTHPVWWDTAVYASMGKYIYSFGQFGLWEPVRPIIFPILMGLAFKFSPNLVLLWGFVLQLFFSTALVYLTYLVGKEIFNEKTGLVAALLLSFTPVFFYFGYIPLSDIPSTFFAVLAIYFFIKKKDIAAGVFAAIATLTRFPQGLIFITMLLLCFNVRRFLKTAGAFLITLLPYLVLNFILYNNPILPFIEGSGVIAAAGLWLFEGEWYYYIIQLFKDNLFFAFALVGLFFSRERRYSYVVLPLLILFFYFSTLAHKEVRFALIFLPYLSIISSYGFFKIFRRKRLFYLAIAIVLVLFAFNIRLERSTDWDEIQPFYSFLEGEKIGGVILTSNPIVGLYTNAKLQLLYYPVFNQEVVSYWIDYLKANKEQVPFIFIDTCAGLLCPPQDNLCLIARQNFEDFVKESYKELFYKEGNGCYYQILKWQNI